METRRDVNAYLTSRRAKVRPADVGLPDLGNRRVPGLRREEVAVLAGVSVPYYTRLERGDLRASPTPSSTRWPARCASTTPNGPTSSTSPAPRSRCVPTRRRGARGSLCGRRYSRSSTR